MVDDTMKALCIRADTPLFRVGESYDIVKEDKWMDTVHVATGNFFNLVLVCSLMHNGSHCGTKIDNEEDTYIFEICKRRK